MASSQLEETQKQNNQIPQNQEHNDTSYEDLKEVNPFRTAQERAVEWGGGLMAAVKAGAIQDHLQSLKNYRKRVNIGNKLMFSLLAAGKPSDDIMSEFEKGEEEDEMSINVSGDHVTNIYGSDKNKKEKPEAEAEAGENKDKDNIIDAINKLRPIPQPSQPASKQESLIPDWLKTAGIATAMGLGGLGLGYGFNANKPAPKPAIPQVSKDDIQQINKQILNLQEQLDPRNWKVEVVP